ncbi:MAG: EAL domain-containing protein [Proteobacteria bacterium]|nr:EAL domain-containing protein [Pseudomonadota bacterium]
MERGSAQATPAGAAVAADGASGTTERGPPAPARRHRTVLIVGNDVPRRQALAAALAAGRLEAITADWGNAALCLDSFRPSALVIELGTAAPVSLADYRALRARAPRARVPTIALAATVDAATVDAAARDGVTEVLPQSVEPGLVLHRLGNLLRVHDLLRGWRTSESRRRAIAEALPDTLLRVDAHGTIREVLALGRDGLGLALDVQGPGRRLDDLLPVPADCSFAELCATALARGTGAERELLRPGGDNVQAIDFRLVPIDAGHGLVVLRDISHRHGSDTVRRALHYDSLTGLPNRARFMSRLEDALGGQPRRSSVAVLRLQVDQFRRIEQSLGPAAADELLAEVGRRLIGMTEQAGGTPASAAGHVAIAGRLHQDAFAVLAVDLRGRDACDTIAEHIRSQLARPVSINGRDVRSTVSIGISLWPENGTDPETLLRNAALAANHARVDGTARLYTDTMRLRSLRSLDVEQQLQHALEAGQLSLQYQPKVDVARRRLLGFEALLRWESPVLGRVSPAEIVPVAEQCGLIQPLGEWVMRQACLDARRFNRDAAAPLPVAINVSAGQFAGGDVASTARRAIDMTGIDAALVELELTESVLMQDVGSALRVFHDLRQCGIRLSIDDFGTGYSSLQYLRRLPVNALKIDRSFVKDIADDKSANAICTAVVTLGRSLGLEVVAEGVETVEQASALRARGCTRLQGYLIGRPMPATSVAAWIGRGEWQRAIDRTELPLRAEY